MGGIKPAVNTSRIGRVPRTIARLLLALLAVVALAWRPSAVIAQGPSRNAPNFKPDDSEDALNQLRNAANHAREKQWSEAVDLYQRVIDRYAGNVIKVPRDQPGADPTETSQLYVDARRYCHRLIASLPAEARAAYRNRMDQIAGPWYREGAARRDSRLLLRVVDQAFCSDWGDNALELLGDLAFQEGRFAEALGYYSQLVPDHPDDPALLIHPDPDLDLARVAAKRWLCRAGMGHPPDRTDLDAFARAYPGAGGSLAGRKGPYAQILAQAVASDRLQPPSDPDGRWPTFAGSPERTRVVTGPIDVGQVQWRVDLEKVSSTRASSTRIPGMSGSGLPVRPEQLLAFHPIVLGDQVIICDGSRVTAYNLGDRPSDSDGGDARPVSPAWRHDSENGTGLVHATRTSGVIPRYTLTASGHRIYARMGQSSTPIMRFRGPRQFEPGTSSIIALDWSSQGKLLWEKRAIDLNLPDRPGLPNRSLNFEGTPVADGRNVYAAATDRGQETMLYVVCLDAETGEPCWVRRVGWAQPDPDQLMGGFNIVMNAVASPGDFRHQLLTLDGSRIYYQTNLGAVVALDAETGTTQWVASYPRQDASRMGQSTERDLNPAVVHEGRVLVAPADADSILAFDAATGRLLWKTEPIADDIKLAHVLGVAKGHLVVTGDRVVLLDVATGKVAGSWPDAPNRSHEGYGRGLLAGDLIYWPTKTQIEVLNQQNALRAAPPIELQKVYGTHGGNLAAGDGYLIVAQEDGLVVFCQNSRLIHRYRNLIVRSPEKALNHYRLARAAEAIGEEETALESYREAIRRARPEETVDGLALAGAARDHLFRLLVRQASVARKEQRWDAAIRRLNAAAACAQADSDRLEARLALADVHMEASRPGDAVEDLEQVLLDPRLRPLPVTADDGRRTIRADLLVYDRLAGIVKQHGRAVYKAYDQQAAALLERGRKERDAHVLTQIGRDYPVALAVPDALGALGAVHQSAGRLADAARVYKRLSLVAPDDSRRAEALWAMARVHEQRKLFVVALEIYQDLAARYPAARVGPSGSSAAEEVARKLAREPYARLIDARDHAPGTPPMFRRWQWSPPESRGLRALSTEGVVPSLEAPRIVLGDHNSVTLLDASDGSVRWTARLGERAEWAGYLDDRLIAAGARQVVALDLATGHVLWRYHSGGEAAASARPDPFATPDETPDGTPRRTRLDLHGFRLARGRVFCLRGATELLALDGDTGALDWSFSSPPGEINEKLWVGADRIVLEVDRPNQILVLRTDDGRPVARAPLGESDQLDRPPMPVDDDNVLIVVDMLTVKKLDLDTGQIVWEYCENKGNPVNGPPRLMGGGDLVFELHDGRTLIRLDPATGSKRWSCSLGYEDLSQNPAAIAFDGDRFYAISRFSSTVTLRAISLADGKTCWTTTWRGDEDRWSIALAAHHVFCYPHRGVQDGLDAAEWVPVLVRRRDDGALVQRMLFPISPSSSGDGPNPPVPARGPGPDQGLVTFNLDHLGAVVATPRGVWGLAGREPERRSTARAADVPR